MAAHIQPAGVADAGIAGETAAPPPIRRKRKVGNGIEIVLLTIFAVVMLFPVVWMLETALKDTKDIYAVPAKLITGWTPTLVGAELHRSTTPRGSWRATAGRLRRLSTQGKAVSGTAYSPGTPPAPAG